VTDLPDAVSVGILGGTGPAGRGLGARLAALGIPVVLGSRDAAKAQESAKTIVARWPEIDSISRSLSGATNEEASQAGLVIVATAWEAALPTVKANAGSLAGKVVCSMASAIERRGGELVALVPPRGSIAESIQDACPDCRIVAAFHHLPAAGLAALDRPVDADVLVCGDDPAARSSVARLAAIIPGVRAIEVGGLAHAGALEAMTGVLVGVNSRYRAHSTLRLVGLRDEAPSESGPPALGALGVAGREQ